MFTKNSPPGDGGPLNAVKKNVYLIFVLNQLKSSDVAILPPMEEKLIAKLFWTLISINFSSFSMYPIIPEGRICTVVFIIENEFYYAKKTTSSCNCCCTAFSSSASWYGWSCCSYYCNLHPPNRCR